MLPRSQSQRGGKKGGENSPYFIFADNGDSFNPTSPRAEATEIR